MPADETSRLLAQALDLHGRGALREAEAAYRQVLASSPAAFDALHMLGVVLHQTGRHEEAVVLLRQALRVREDATALSNLGIALRRLGRAADALAAFDRAIALRPSFAQAFNNRGNVLRDLGREEEAVAAYGRAIELAPAHAGALRNRADALRVLGRHEEAGADLARAIAADPGDAESWFAQGNLLAGLGRDAAAVASYEAALRCRPDHVDALNHMAASLLALGRAADALRYAEHALAVAPGHAGARVNAAGALAELERRDEAIALLQQALAASPRDADVRFNLGSLLLDARQPDAAVAVLRDLVASDPGYPLARGQLLHARMACCDWTDFDAERAAVAREVASGRLAIEPFGFQALAEDPAALRACAETFAAARYPLQPALWRGERYAHRRLRIGYVSGEFREQATSILMVEVFERHDRDRFEVFAFDNGVDDGSELRGRLCAAFEKHVPIAALGDDAAAAAIRAREIDVLVNLNGYFGRHRLGVFARRPAPVQVNYLGFPGTIGHPAIGWLIADEVVIPPGEERNYVERIVRLPRCYQANDSRRRTAATVPSRAQAGLPEGAFVFCCFNNNYKILPAVYDAWMRLLGAVPGSVLWLYEENAAAARNLAREAARRGVAGHRIVFAARAKPADHLARHALADLFLDTLPYNAHTTASDALWAGLPIVTCEGATFPGRVAASLLRSLGLDELVTRSPADYEALALALARDRARLARLREALAQRRAASGLFDGAACCRALEAAYEFMGADATARAPGS